MATVDDLLSRGYFPREIPPLFSTQSFARLVQNQPNLTVSSGTETECASHNLARPGGLRRPLRIPNPEGYLRLARVIETQWPLLDKHFKTQHLSLSRPVSSRLERALEPRFRRGEEPKLRARLWRGQRFVLRADISQFYSTIYTHSIPWALHTKRVAKRKRNKTEGDKIDRALRLLSSGQTVGVPIGPDASLAIAETILTAIDGLLKKELKAIRGYRHADDYELAFSRRSDAEDALVALEGLLRDFELSLNPFKTYVVELPQPFQETWVGELLSFPIRVGRSTQTLTDTIAFFSKAFELAHATPRQGVLKYALRRSDSIPVDRKFWPTFQSLVLSTVSAEPTTMPVALDLLRVQAKKHRLHIDQAAVAETVEPLIIENARLRNGSEVAWALWTASSLGVDLSKKAAAALSKMDDDLVALLALDAAARGRFPSGGLDDRGWQKLVAEPDSLKGQHWLLAYEATTRGWIANVDPVPNDPFFLKLRREKVSFIHRAPKRRPYRGPAGPIPGGMLPDSSL